MRERETSLHYPHVRGATTLRPKPDRSVRLYGMWHSSFLPFYFLGLAQYNSGEEIDALKSLGRAKAWSVARHEPVAYKKLTRLKNRILASLGEAAPLASSPAMAITSRRQPGFDDEVFNGLQAFFRGDHDGAVASFHSALKSGAKAELTVHEYPGMAYAGKAAADAERAEIFRDPALLEFQKVHGMDNEYRLSSGVFSEDMVALFEEARR